MRKDKKRLVEKAERWVHDGYYQVNVRRMGWIRGNPKGKLCQSFAPRFPLSLLLPCKAFGFRPNYK